MTIDFSAWTKATGDLLPGQQRVFLDVLNLVSEGKAHLVHGADYRNGKPCLVNAVGQMLSTGGGAGIPSREFSEVVCQFDILNGRMLEEGINVDGYVAPLAADFLIRNFGELKPMTLTKPDEGQVAPKYDDPPYIEPDDATLAASWLSAMAAPAPQEVAQRTDDEAEYVRSHVEHRNV